MGQRVQPRKWDVPFACSGKNSLRHRPVNAYNYGNYSRRTPTSSSGGRERKKGDAFLLD